MTLVLLLIGCASSAWEKAQEACLRSEEDCRDHLVSDFGVEEDTFTEEGLEAFVAGATELVLWDLGAWPPDTGEFVREPFLDLLDGDVGDSTTERLYNFAVDKIQDTREIPDQEYFLAYYGEGNLGTNASVVYSSKYAVYLGHEASHAVVHDHQICDGEYCDLDWSGAFGVQAAVADLALATCDEDYSCDRLEDARTSAVNHIWENGEEPAR